MELNVSAFLTKDAKTKTESSKRLLFFVRNSINCLTETEITSPAHMVEVVNQAYTNLRSDLDNVYPGLYDVRLVDEHEDEFSQDSQQAIFLIDFQKTLH